MSESKLRRWLNEEDGPLERVMLASQNREPYREPEENSEAEQELYRREILEARTVEKQLKALNEKRFLALALLTIQPTMKCRSATLNKDCRKQALSILLQE